ncbi:MAG: hypothetical protein JXN64_13295 [Spirochaetes bacterium]|nr:hypothetical protein [Spirochaetota bacterium]
MKGPEWAKNIDEHDIERMESTLIHTAHTIQKIKENIKAKGRWKEYVTALRKAGIKSNIGNSRIPASAVE